MPNNVWSWSGCNVFFLFVNLIFNLIVCLFVCKCCYTVLDALPYHFWLLCTPFIAHHATINVKYRGCTDQKLCFLNLFPVDSPLAGDWNWQRSLVREYQYGKLDKDWTTFTIFCRRQYCNFMKWSNSKTWKSACFLFHSWFGCMAVWDQFWPLQMVSKRVESTTMGSRGRLFS